MHQLLRLPLFRLLAINLATGISAAVLMLGGLLLINPFHLRDLIFEDSAGGIAAGLLLFGFVITFGSTAMGTAIMTLPGRTPNPGEPPRSGDEAPVLARAR